MNARNERLRDRLDIAEAKSRILGIAFALADDSNYSKEGAIAELITVAEVIVAIEDAYTANMNTLETYEELLSGRLTKEKANTDGTMKAKTI
jgi:hypothetical protein